MTNWPEDPRAGTDAAQQYRMRSQDQAAPPTDAVEQYQAQPQNWAYEAPQPYAPGYPQAQAQSNGMALASMILGITSIVFCWWGIFSLAQIVLAIVFGVIGLGRAKAGAGGRGQALAGIICGSVGAFFYLIVGILTVGVGFLI